MAPRRDTETMSLFDWQPPQVAVGYDEGVAGRGALDNKIARLLARALRDAKDGGLPRAEVAKRMAEELGRPLPVTTLDKWTSESAESHRISLDAFIALIKVTGQTDLLGFIPALFGFAVVPERFVEMIELHQIEEHERDIAARKAALQARVRGRR